MHLQVYEWATGMIHAILSPRHVVTMNDSKGTAAPPLPQTRRKQSFPGQRIVQSHYCTPGPCSNSDTVGH